MLITSSFTWRARSTRQLANKFIPLAVVMVLSLSGIFTASASSPASNLLGQSSRYFPSTGLSVGGAFLQFFDAHGGVRVFGYPITGEMAEGGRTVQYFERQRFEYHPEAAGTEYQVQLGMLGVASAQGNVSLSPVGAPPVTSASKYFRETGHTLSGTFLSFWQTNGGVRILGYPISEPAKVNGYLTQYFERVRMEYHPEVASSGYAVELGQLGREYLTTHTRTVIAGTTSKADADLSPQSKQLLDLLNGARQRAGSKPVAPNDQLSAVAQQRSNDMAVRGYFAHVTPEGKGFEDFLKSASIRFKFGGEILAKGNVSESLIAIRSFEWFMDSPAHRDILLDARFNAVGVGEAKDSQGYYVFTVIFVQTP